jgi:hypothetical protein
MTVALITLAILSAGLSVIIAMLSRDQRRLVGELVSAGKREIAEQTERNLAEQKVRELDFELRNERAALAAARVRTRIIEEELAHAGTNLGDGLAPGDVAGRVRRIAEAYRAAHGDPVRADASPGVHQPTATAGAEPADVHADALVDVQF